MIAEGIVEPILEVPQGTLGTPANQLSDHGTYELTLVLETRYSSRKVNIYKKE